LELFMRQVFCLISFLLCGLKFEFIYFVFRCYSFRCVVFFRSIFVLLWLIDLFKSSIMLFTIPVVKPTRCTSFSNYLFLNNTVHVSDGLSVHHQEFKTLHTPTDICQTAAATNYIYKLKPQKKVK
jgi:hypothetical protein